jgi:hypothetical protein
MDQGNTSTGLHTGSRRSLGNTAVGRLAHCEPGTFRTLEFPARRDFEEHDTEDAW